MRLPIWGRPGETRIEAVGGTFEDIGYERVLVHPEVQKILEEFYQDDRVPFVDEYVPGTTALNHYPHTFPERGLCGY
eukprot:m.921466 g.921466  ORF g.921466 m.921466 type:complete len:77 (+) comp23757_c0_seq24:853-1083(+)